MAYLERYRTWCESPYFDEAVKEELRGIAGDEKEIEDRFYRELEFGTGGLRGILGAGTNRMNIYTVRKATQGLANYIKKEQAQSKGVAIAFDSRKMSPEFADEAARCLAANGIKAYRFQTLRPTPELSFALRYLGCAAGIVITASHNPREYNGYKVYWEEGAQVTTPRDREIMAEVQAVCDFADVKTMTAQEAKEQGLYEVIGEEVDAAYMAALKGLVLRPEAVEQMAKELKIVYTPLHGSGNLPVRRVLKELGFSQVFTVASQELPDGAFPTVPSPNPEDPDAFAQALILAKSVDADLVLATDPDADRLGVYVKDSVTGGYHALSGNMSGMLICEYELSQKKELGNLPENGAIVTTIVSTDMAKQVAAEYGAAYKETLTGFKYIGEQIKKFEEKQDFTYLFGFEESYGCLVGTHARDKDACVAVMALCEAAAYYRVKGLTLWEQMLHLYKKYGYYQETLWTQVYPGADGLQNMKFVMGKMRAQIPHRVGTFTVLAVRDYGRGIRMNLRDAKEEALDLPSSDVLYFELEGNGWVCVRPSGTEPKIKYYAGVKGESMQDADQKLKNLKFTWKSFVNG